MPTTKSYGTSLAELPSDIIRKIIRFGQTDLDAMLMISRRWNSLCRVPVPWMRWQVIPAENTISFCIPERLRKALRVTKWRFKWLQSDTDAESMVEIRKDINSCTYGILSLASFFRRCFRIEKCFIDAELSWDRSEIPHLARCLSHCTVGELLISGLYFINANSAEAILDLLRCRTVKTLRVFDYNFCDLSNIHQFISNRTNRTFFVDAARAVSEVEIESTKSRESARVFGKILESVVKNLNQTRRIEAKLVTEKFDDDDDEIRYIIRIVALQSQ